jgi:hypothetical protein
MRPTVELIYFSNCPHVESARRALEKAFKALRMPPEWQEWEQHDPNAPAVVRIYPSPTVLINGCDVQGGAGMVSGHELSGRRAAECRRDPMGASRDSDQ